MNDQPNSQPLDFQALSQKLDQAKSILILLPNQPSLDSVGAGLALFLSFKQQNKNVVIGCPQPLSVNYNQLVAANKVTDKIGSRNLIISFDYLKDSIEKVSYNIKDDKFNLVIQPKGKTPPLDPEKVSYSYTGTQADLIFVVGANRLEALGKLYEQEKKIFNDKTIVNIDNKQNNGRFGQINLVQPEAASCSEIVAELIKSLNLAVNDDVATNLYAGIKANTANFQARNVTAQTFETIAWCLKNGAKKEFLTSQPSQQPVQFQQPTQKQQPGATMPTPQQVPQQAPTIQAPFRQPKKQTDAPPPDWFKPKIYKGGSLI